MDNTLFDIWVSSRMEFSNEDKIKCFDTVRTLVDIATDVRKFGILSLDVKISEITAGNIFLKNALSLAIDCVDPDYMKKRLHNYIIAGNYRGEELLRRILITEGVLGIVNGENPKMLESGLLSYFGEDFILPVHHGERAANKIKLRDYPEGTNLLEEPFRNLDDLAVQILVRDLSSTDVIIAMHGSSEYVINRITSNMSKKSAEMIMDDYFLCGNIETKDIVAAQTKIINKIDELAKIGNITK